MDDAYIARPCNTHTIKLTVSLNAIDFFIKILRKRNTQNRALYLAIKCFSNRILKFLRTFITFSCRVLFLVKKECFAFYCKRK